jgi:hypothetical protein
MSDKKQSKLYEMAVRGTEFEDEYEFELYGEPVTAIIKPLVDDEFLPIAAFLSEHLDVDEDNIEEGEAVSEAVEKVEEASDEDSDSPVDVSQLDEEFVGAMQEAAILGLHGSYDEDGNKVEHTDEEVEFIVTEALMGGYSVELGSKVLEISGDVREAEKFRGTRGSVADTRDK